MSCGINVTNLISVESLADFNNVCDCCAEGSIVYVNSENAFYQVQYGQLVKKVDLPLDDIASKSHVDTAVAAGAGVPMPVAGSTFVSSTSNGNFTLPADGTWLWFAQFTTENNFTWPLRVGISPGGTVITATLAGSPVGGGGSNARSCFAWRIA